MKLKQLFISIGVLFIANLSSAQAPNFNSFRSDLVFNSSIKIDTKSNLALPYHALSNFNEEKYQKFKKMRTKGIILTGVGAGLITTGAILIASAENDKNDFYDFDGDNGEGKAIAGVLSILFGTLSTGGGITMWVIGNNKMKKYGGGQVSLQSNKAGLSVAYRF